MTIALLCALVAAFVLFVLWVVLGHTALGVAFFSLLVLAAGLWLADFFRNHR